MTSTVIDFPILALVGVSSMSEALGSFPETRSSQWSAGARAIGSRPPPLPQEGIQDAYHGGAPWWASPLWASRIVGASGVTCLLWRYRAQPGAGIKVLKSSQVPELRVESCCAVD